MAEGTLFGATTEEVPKQKAVCPVEALWALQQGRQTLEAQLWNHGKYGVEARLLRDGDLVTGRRFETWAKAERFLEVERAELERQGWSAAPAVAETEQLVGLVTAQNRLASAWLKHLVTVEAAMMLAFTFLLRPVASIAEPRYQLVLGLVVPLLGTVLAVVMGKMVLNERRWASWYIERLKNPKLTPTVMPGPGDIRRQTIGRTGGLVVLLVTLLVIGWIGVLVLLQPWRAWSALYRLVFLP